MIVSKVFRPDCHEVLILENSCADNQSCRMGIFLNGWNFRVSGRSDSDTPHRLHICPEISDQGQTECSGGVSGVFQFGKICMKRIAMLSAALALAVLPMLPTSAQEAAKPAEAGKPADAAKPKEAGVPAARIREAGDTKPETKATIEVKVKVLDSAGNPAAGAQVGTSWIINEGKNVLGGGNTCDDSGLAVISMDPRMKPRLTNGLPVYAINSDGTHGIISMMYADSLDNGVSLSLLPLSAVTGAISKAEVEGAEGGISFSSSTNITVGDKTVNLRGPGTRSIGDEGKLSVMLPAGEHTLSFRSTRSHGWVTALASVDGKGSPVDLGVLEVPVNAQVFYKGKVAPEISVTEARNTVTNEDGSTGGMTLADYKGKWLVVEFWGYW